MAETTPLSAVPSVAPPAATAAVEAAHVPGAPSFWRSYRVAIWSIAVFVIFVAVWEWGFRAAGMPKYIVPTLTGASLNPARSFGPALFLSTVDASRRLNDLLNPMFYLIYFMGPFIGAILATMLYQFLKSESDMTEESAMEEGVVKRDEPM